MASQASNAAFRSEPPSYQRISSQDFGSGDRKKLKLRYDAIPPRMQLNPTSPGSRIHSIAPILPIGFPGLDTTTPRTSGVAQLLVSCSY